MTDPNYKEKLNQAAQQLQDPFRFRIFVTLVALAVAYFGIYAPLSGKIADTKRLLKKETERETLAQDVDMLRAQMDFFEDRLTKDVDANEWIQYVLGGVRQLPLELINLDSEEERKVGPYRAVAMRLSVAGHTQDLDALLQWLETNERIFRIDVLTMEPSRDDDGRRMMTMTLLGLRG